MDRDPAPGLNVTRRALKLHLESVIADCEDELAPGVPAATVLIDLEVTRIDHAAGELVAHMVWLRSLDLDYPIGKVHWGWPDCAANADAHAVDALAHSRHWRL
ncbi:MAG: hypothetical protein ACRDQD_17355 [Nocardioidaceae bacterium]